MTLEREGWPDYRQFGLTSVEVLPLRRIYTGGDPYFVTFDEERRRFALSELGTWGQEITWFDCDPWGE